MYTPLLDNLCLQSPVSSIQYPVTSLSYSHVLPPPLPSVPNRVLPGETTDSNGAKSATKRDRNATKAGKGKAGSQKASNEKAMSIVCKVCRAVSWTISTHLLPLSPLTIPPLSLCQLTTHLCLSVSLSVCFSLSKMFTTLRQQTFMCTMTEASLRQHVEGKHPKLEISACFDHLT